MLAPLALVLPAIASAAPAAVPDSVTYDVRLKGDVAYVHNQSYEGGAATDQKTVSFMVDALIEGVRFEDGKLASAKTSTVVAITNVKGHSRHVTDVGQTVATCDPSRDGQARAEGFTSLSIAPFVNDRPNLDPHWLSLSPFTSVTVPATCTDNQDSPPSEGDLGLSNVPKTQDAASRGRAPLSWQFKLDPKQLGEKNLSWNANRIVPAALCPDRDEATSSCQEQFKGRLTMNRVEEEQLAPAAEVAPKATVAPGGSSVSTRARCRRKPACTMEVWIYVPPKRGSGRRGSLRSGMSIRPLAHRRLSLRAGGGWSTLTVPLDVGARRTAQEAGTIEVVVEASAPKAKTVRRVLTAKVG